MVTGRVDGTGVIELRTPPLKLVAKLYSLSILVREKGFQKLLCAQGGGSLQVRHPLHDTNFGVYHETATWSRGEAS
jgi:lipopolysaccharide transport system ATP-binding protein